MYTHIILETLSQIVTFPDRELNMPKVAYTIGDLFYGTRSPQRSDSDEPYSKQPSQCNLAVFMGNISHGKALKVTHVKQV